MNAYLALGLLNLRISPPFGKQGARTIILGITQAHKKYDSEPPIAPLVITHTQVAYDVRDNCNINYANIARRRTTEIGPRVSNVP